MILDTKPTLDTFTCFWIRFSVFGYVLIDFRCYFWIRSFFGYVWIRLKVFGYLWIRLDTFGYVWIRLDMATQLILDTFGRGVPPLPGSGTAADKMEPRRTDHRTNAATGQGW